MTKDEVIESIEEALKDKRSILIRIFAGTLVNALKYLKLQPQIVRCKDCNNGVIHCENGDIICDHIDSSGNDTHPADWFCADGERRTD